MMHSHGIYNVSLRKLAEVLILVVMDDALAQKGKLKWKQKN